jgi:hypothetical protein
MDLAETDGNNERVEYTIRGDETVEIVEIEIL